MNFADLSKSDLDNLKKSVTKVLESAGGRQPPQEEEELHVPVTNKTALSTLKTRFPGRQLGVIGELADNTLLAMTFYNQEDAVDFFVLSTDDRDDTHTSVKFHFKWSLDFYWRQFGFVGQGGCCMPGPTDLLFHTVISNSGQYAMIMGPTEKPYGQTDWESTPAVKLLCISSAGVSVKVGTCSTSSQQ